MGKKSAIRSDLGFWRVMLLVDRLLHIHAPNELLRQVVRFLADTNFVVIGKLVSRDWSEWCGRVEREVAKHVPVLCPFVGGSAEYCRALQVRCAFPAETYATVERLCRDEWCQSLDGLVWERREGIWSRSLDLKYRLRAARHVRATRMRLCTVCARIKTMSNQNRRVCVGCLVKHKCRACWTRDSIDSLGRCFRCAAAGRVFPDPVFRL